MSEDGKALRYYELRPFAIHLTSETIAIAARTLTIHDPHVNERKCG